MLPQFNLYKKNKNWILFLNLLLIIEKKTKSKITSKENILFIYYLIPFIKKRALNKKKYYKKLLILFINKHSIQSTNHPFIINLVIKLIKNKETLFLIQEEIKRL